MREQSQGETPDQARESAQERSRNGVAPLKWLNFFMADMQAGIGPFVGVFLLAHGWTSGLIGNVMAAAGAAGTVASMLAGAHVDATSHKRAYVIVPGACAVLASALILVSQNFWIVGLSQVATAVAGAAIIPAVNGITLGIVRQRGFNQQNGRNQSFNHAGNVVGAALSGFLGWRFGLPAVFLLAVVFACASIGCALMIPKGAIDHAAARGLEKKSDGGGGEVSGFRILAKSKPLIVLAAALACFHLGNGGMLPLFALAVAATKKADPSSLVATTIVVSQGVMILMSLVAMRLVESEGYWRVLLISFLALPIRGLIAAFMISPWGVYPVEALDGVGAGLQSVAVSGLVARILNGTGRVNAGQGAVMTIQGLGASLSPAIGGWIGQTVGYEAAFIVLGCFALGSIALWIVFAPTLKPACAHPWSVTNSQTEGLRGSDGSAAAN